ncbi:hypothetical protein C6366_16065 [Desulfonatronum sp. SC1]|nr:hypothetical protein C6366_16065 [Desulfonatronum sp. SC1]
MKYHQADISKMVTEFQKYNSSTDRYASFDYCYCYFHPTSDNDLLGDIEKSCLSLGFYLASWGMLRGSSFLLNRSVKHYEPLIRYIAGLDSSVWDIDVDQYSGKNIKSICSIYRDIQRIIVNNGNSHLTLVTKIMLGVFGFIPAFDNYFGNTFREIFQGECGFRSVNQNSLNCIQQFYDDNREEIDMYSSKIYVKEFTTGDNSGITYKKSKIIDMYGFTKGLKKST